MHRGGGGEFCALSFHVLCRADLWLSATSPSKIPCRFQLLMKVALLQDDSHLERLPSDFRVVFHLEEWNPVADFSLVFQQDFSCARRIL